MSRGALYHQYHLGVYSYLASHKSGFEHGSPAWRTRSLITILHQSPLPHYARPIFYCFNVDQSPGGCNYSASNTFAIITWRGVAVCFTRDQFLESVSEVVFTDSFDKYVVCYVNDAYILITKTEVSAYICCIHLTDKYLPSTTANILEKESLKKVSKCTCICTLILTHKATMTNFALSALCLHLLINRKLTRISIIKT